MTNKQTADHIRQWVETSHDHFAWATDTCGYDQHIRFVKYRNRFWKQQCDFKEFMLCYANNLEFYPECEQSMRFYKDDSLIPNPNPLKPFRYPEGFVLVQDTREQRPLFKDDTVVPYITKTEKNGDYTNQGQTSRIPFERKQISDLYSYIGKERDKTIAKMQQFKWIIESGGFVSLIIESTEEDVLFGNQFSQVTPEMVRHALVSFQIRYGIHVYFSNDRDYLRRYILDHAIKFYKVLREV